MMGPDEITGWDAVDLAGAELDDFRPVYALMSAIRERAAAAGQSWFDGNFAPETLNGVTGYLNAPSIAFLRTISEAIHELAPRFVNLSPSVPYTVNHYQDFPVCFSSFDITNSDHPLSLLPMQGSTAEALPVYRRFLADARHWLGRFRYVYATATGATKLATGSASVRGNDPEALASEFAESVTVQNYRGRCRNGSAVFGDYDGGVYRCSHSVSYDSDGETVRDVETKEWLSARGREVSGVWVANNCPIPATVLVFWGFDGPILNKTSNHPGTSVESSKAGVEVCDDKRAEGLWGDETKVVRDQKTENGVTTDRQWTYSPDGTQSREETRSWDEQPPSGRYLRETREEETYTGGGWTYAADSRTDFGEVSGGGSLAILPEKSTLDFPPLPSTEAPEKPGYPYSETSVTRSLNTGPITFHAVLDYGPHYKFP